MFTPPWLQGHYPVNSFLEMSGDEANEILRKQKMKKCGNVEKPGRPGAK